MVSRGGIYIVGLLDNAVRESLSRIEAAVKNSGYRWPRLKTIINLAPANIRMEGSAYDLPIALGMMAGAGLISSDGFDQYFIICLCRPVQNQSAADVLLMTISTSFLPDAERLLPPIALAKASHTGG